MGGGGDDEGRKSSESRDGQVKGVRGSVRGWGAEDVSAVRNLSLFTNLTKCCKFCRA